MEINIFNHEKHEGYKDTQNILNLLKKDSDVKQISIYPELANKKIGLPNGTLIQTENHIYPFAVHDPGCGYRVILTDLFADDLINHQKSILDELADENGLYNKIRINKLLSINFSELWKNGILSLKKQYGPLTQSKIIPNFNKNIIKELNETEIENYIKNFAVAGSPFLEFRYSDRTLKLNNFSIKKNQIIIIIHLGTLVGNQIISGKYLEKSIINTLQYNIYNESDIQNYLFFLDYKSNTGKNYLDFINFMINYAYSSRLVSSSILNEFLNKLSNNKIRFKIISDLTHSSIKKIGKKIYHARGLQLANNKKNPLLIGGDTNTPSYLVLTKDNNNYISHGTGKYINKYEDYINYNSGIETHKVITNRDYYYNKEKENYDVTTSIKGLENKINILCKLNPFINYWNDN